MRVLARRGGGVRVRVSVPVDAGDGADRIRVVIVDDHTIVREGLRSILELETTSRSSGTPRTRPGRWRRSPRRRPDVVLLDLKLSAAGPATGLDLCEEIVARHPRWASIVLTTFHDQGLVLDALRRGAKGYVLKDVDVVDLVKIIRAVRRGERASDSQRVMVAARCPNRTVRPRLTRAGAGDHPAAGPG